MISQHWFSNGLEPSSNKPLPEPTFTQILSPYGVTRPQWVYLWTATDSYQPFVYCPPIGENVFDMTNNKSNFLESMSNFVVGIVFIYMIWHPADWYKLTTPSPSSVRINFNDSTVTMRRKITTFGEMLTNHLPQTQSATNRSYNLWVTIIQYNTTMTNKHFISAQGATL